MGWDDVRKGNGGGDYTEIKEGRPVTVHLLGDDPKRHAEHWNSKKEVKECSGAGCIACDDPTTWKEAKVAYSVPVFNLTTNRTETLKKGYSIFKIIRETREAYKGNLSNVDFRLSAEGSGLETKYSVIPIVPTSFKSQMVTEGGSDSEETPF